MFCSERHVHLIMEKHVMRYLKGTIDYGPRYISDYEIRFAGLHIFRLDRQCHRPKSTSGCCFSMGSTVISSQ
jgi:hypothetical protein